MAQPWLTSLTQSSVIRDLDAALRKHRRVGLGGQAGSSATLICGALAQQTGRPMLILTGHLDDADAVVDDLSLLENLSVRLFPALEVLPGESHVAAELLSQRLATVADHATGHQAGVMVAPIQALMQGVPRAESLPGLIRELKPGDRLSMDDLAAWLETAGYRRSDAVEEPGDYAMRGGILDVFPPNGAPVRADFFGDELESLTEIDLDSMGSDHPLEVARLLTVRDDDPLDPDRVVPLWSLLSDDTQVVLLDIVEIEEQARGYYERLTDPVGVFPPHVVHQALGKHACIEVQSYGAAALANHQMNLPVSRLPEFDTDVVKAVAELDALTQDHRVVVLCEREAERHRLEQLIAEHAQSDAIEIAQADVAMGFVWALEGDRPMAVVPYRQLAHRYGTRKRVRKVGGVRGTDAFFDLEIGDYVVHVQHGIARFNALRMMERDGSPGEEYLTLEFADRVLLHVPASQIELVHKYVGGSGRPNLSKLGGTRWKRQKAQAADAAKDLAVELLRVQAAREAMPGLRCNPDTLWMNDFEAAFPYEETEDQLAAMAAIKKDMSTTRPMDRLLCGDVGYGKTEMAIRAAFMAAEAGRQVAILCPTTVLCQQHEQTIRDRLSSYPFRVAALNRFKTATELSQTLEGLADGSVDVVVGTHRLLSQDVRFANLGLVVIDEEQKFGVEHKQKLMRFRLTVDVLSMSATPIPRTLNMALLGLRDISSLATPPVDRRAVVTEVVPYDRQRVRTALVRELSREGQCFVVHNRVHSIRDVAAEIKALIPEAEVVVGHGQMTARELEAVMLKFMRREADILVCTTIIESGIDIPNANTIIITDSDRYGLAELHQLRGRVGRSHHRAYCYLLLPEDRPLSDVARQRLRALERYAMLGAGFKIAMRDMEIRGVGNLLGSQQSGHIEAVGYEMYCRLLEQSTAELRDGEAPIDRETHLDLPGLAGHLPRSYIPSDKHRMTIYRRIARARDAALLGALERDLKDAYGAPPPAARALLDLAAVRVGLAAIGVHAVRVEDRDLVYVTENPRALETAIGRKRGSVRLVDAPTIKKPGTVYHRPPSNYLDRPETLLRVLKKMFAVPPGRSA